MKIFREPKKLQKWSAAQKLAGRKIALVPTMGYLHEGHLSLIAKAKAKGADEIVVSVFVNPVQFGPGEDYEKYPRDEKADLAKCRAAGATAVFFPTPENMYLDRHSVYVNEEELSKGLCGARRPGHFRGVCTVVAKLFNLAHPDFAVFGQKDYQQAQIIRRMVRDLNFDLEIVVAPIVREPSGLARSSRNTYLSSEEKERALAISRGLASLGGCGGAGPSRLPTGGATVGRMVGPRGCGGAGRTALPAGDGYDRVGGGCGGAGRAALPPAPPRNLPNHPNLPNLFLVGPSDPLGRVGLGDLAGLRRYLTKAGLKVDYVECVDAETLEPRKKVTRGCCVLVAVYDGKTRLIDNILI